MGNGELSTEFIDCRCEVTFSPFEGDRGLFYYNAVDQEDVIVNHLLDR